MADKFEGSDYEGYICVYINDDDFSREILTEFDFKEIEADFYYKNLDDFDKIKDEKIEEIKLSYSDKYSKIAKRNEYRKRIIKLKRIWGDIGDKTYEINQYSYKKYGAEFFMPTLKTLNLSLKLTNIVVSDERSFGQFCYYLYQYGNESIQKHTQIQNIAKLLQKKYPDKDKTKKDAKRILEELLDNDLFYNQIHKLRNYEIHLKTNFISEVKQIYLNKIGKLPTNSFEYFLLQLKILKYFKLFLKNTYDFLTTKL